MRHLTAACSSTADLRISFGEERRGGREAALRIPDLRYTFSRDSSCELQPQVWSESSAVHYLKLCLFVVILLRTESLICGYW